MGDRTDQGAQSRGRETSQERAGIAQAEAESRDWERGDGSRIAGGGDGLETCARNGQGLVPLDGGAGGDGGAKELSEVCPPPDLLARREEWARSELSLGCVGCEVP